jgi:hypothetical protein
MVIRQKTDDLLAEESVDVCQDLPTNGKPIIVKAIL